jgi:hypothetical protein
VSTSPLIRAYEIRKAAAVIQRAIVDGFFTNPEEHVLRVGQTDFNMLRILLAARFGDAVRDGAAFEQERTEVTESKL